jgi:hypothetical protein
MDKLIAVGMRHIPGAQSYIKANFREKDQSVRLTPVLNKEATGGIAYAVEHRGTKIAYIREAELSQLKHFLHTDTCNTVPFKTSGDYVVSGIFENYLVLKRNKTASETIVSGQKNVQVNPCSEIYLDTVSTPLYYASTLNPLNSTKKEITMFDKIVAANKTVAVTAAYMEAGRVANNQVTKLVAAKAPMMVRGYVDTPMGKVVLANLTMMAVDQFRPTDARLKKVANAMAASAYQELIQTLDIEGMLNELTSSEGIKNALAVVAGQELAIG